MSVDTFLKMSEDFCPFCGATDAPVLDLKTPCLCAYSSDSLLSATPAELLATNKEVDPFSSKF